MIILICRGIQRYHELQSGFLPVQLQETGRPVVLALNMADELPQIGRTIDFAALSRELKLPVFPVSAANGSGIAELLQGCRSEAARSARQREKRLFTAPAVSSGGETGFSLAAGKLTCTGGSVSVPGNVSREALIKFF